MKRNLRALGDRRGFVLIAVMIVVSMLSYSAYEFTHWISVETETTILQVHEVQARYMAESGVALVEAMAILKARGREVPDPENYADLFGAITIPLTASDALAPAGGSADLKDSGRFTVFSSPATQDESTSMGMSEKLIRYGTEPEAARIHINHWFQTNPAALEAALLLFPNSSKEIVDALLDWLDPDNEPRASGGEWSAYEESEPTVVPRNGPIESIEELLQVRGMTPAILFGEDINRNGILDPNEDDGEKTPPLDNQDGKLDRGWSALLTLWNQENNLDSKGQPRIYLNDPQIGMLYGLLEREFGVDFARFVIAARVIGMPSMLPPPIPTPGGFQFGSVLDLVDANVTGVWENRPVALVSPVSSASADFGKQLEKIFERLTTDPAPVRVGRVDVAAAPKEVLGLLTTLTDEEREKIIKERLPVDMPKEMNSAEVASPSTALPLKTIAWLTVNQFVSLPSLRSIENSITSASPVVRFQSVGFTEANRVSYRIEVVMDRSALPPQIVSWRRLDRWGAGISLEQLGRGTEEKALPALGESNSELSGP